MADAVLMSVVAFVDGTTCASIGLPYTPTGYPAELIGHLARCFRNAQLRGEVVKLLTGDRALHRLTIALPTLGIRQLVGERGEVGVGGDLRPGCRHAALEGADVPTVLARDADNVRFLVGGGRHRGIAAEDVAARLSGPLFFGAGRLARVVPYERDVFEALVNDHLAAVVGAVRVISPTERVLKLEIVNNGKRSGNTSEASSRELRVPVSPDASSGTSAAV